MYFLTIIFNTFFFYVLILIFWKFVLFFTFFLLKKFSVKKYGPVYFCFEFTLFGLTFRLSYIFTYIIFSQNRWLPVRPFRFKIYLKSTSGWLICKFKIQKSLKPFAFAFVLTFFWSGAEILDFMNTFFSHYGN